MGRLRPLFEKYRVAAYFSGHEHMLAIETSKPNQPVTYFISGAGSKTNLGCDGRDWGTPDGTLGFLHASINDEEMRFEFVDATTINPKVVYQGSITPRP